MHLNAEGAEEARRAAEGGSNVTHYEAESLIGCDIADQDPCLPTGRLRSLLANALASSGFVRKEKREHTN